MAVTSLWKVVGRLDCVINYASDKEKTENHNFGENDLQGLRDVMNYTFQDYKTEKQHYISGINCTPETARQNMMITKRQYQKMDGIIAFHGYQSFLPGEVTPDVAHEIGVKLAQKMWGNRFEVVVATHLDKSHVHNHFVINSVSFSDGYKYYSNNQSRELLRFESDKLCAEYELSVITEPKTGRRPHYAVYLAEQQGKPTMNSMIKDDVDIAIAQSLTDKQFFTNLKRMGYEVIIGQDITVRPPGKKYGKKLYRNFGEEYLLDAIKRRILSQAMPERNKYYEPQPVKQVYFKDDFNPICKFTGYRALYARYFHFLGVLPRQRQQPSPREIPIVFREDIRKMHQMSNEMKLLGRNRINSVVQLSAYKSGLKMQMDDLSDQRKCLRYKSRSIKDETALTNIKLDISELSGQLGELRREVKLCESIETRIAEMKEKIKIAAEIRAKEQMGKSKIKETGSRVK